MIGARPESEFPTILDARDRLSELVDKGLGDLPVQLFIVPSSTMKALSRLLGSPGLEAEKQALMIELTPDVGIPRAGLCLISTSYLEGNSNLSRSVQ